MKQTKSPDLNDSLFETTTDGEKFTRPNPRAMKPPFANAILRFDPTPQSILPHQDPIATEAHRANSKKPGLLNLGEPKRKRRRTEACRSSITVFLAIVGLVVQVSQTGPGRQGSKSCDRPLQADWNGWFVVSGAINVLVGGMAARHCGGKTGHRPKNAKPRSPRIEKETPRKKEEGKDTNRNPGTMKRTDVGYL